MRDRTDHDPAFHRIDASVTDIGGGRQADAVGDVGLDVAPVGIGAIAAERDRVAAGHALAEAQFQQRLLQE